MHTKYGVSNTRGGGVMIIRIQKFEKYYHEISSNYRSSGCGLRKNVSCYRWSFYVSSLKNTRFKGAELWRKIFEGIQLNYVLKNIAGRCQFDLTHPNILAKPTHKLHLYHTSIRRTLLLNATYSCSIFHDTIFQIFEFEWSYLRPLWRQTLHTWYVYFSH
jgi:hypothetical protein